MKALKPTERSIVVIGEARTPACVKTEQGAARRFPDAISAPRPRSRSETNVARAPEARRVRRREEERGGSSSGSSSATNTTPRLAALRSAAKATLSRRDAAILATLTEGFSQGGIRAIAQSVLTERRVALLTEGKTRHDGDALSSGEFVDRIARFGEDGRAGGGGAQAVGRGAPGADKFEPERGAGASRRIRRS